MNLATSKQAPLWDLLKATILYSCDTFFAEYKIENVVYAPNKNLYSRLPDLSRWLSIQIPFKSDQHGGYFEVICDPAFAMATWPIGYNSDFDQNFLLDWLGELANQILSRTSMCLYEWGIDFLVSAPLSNAVLLSGLPKKRGSTRIQIPLVVADSAMHIFCQIDNHQEFEEFSKPIVEKSEEEDAFVL